MEYITLKELSDKTGIPLTTLQKRAQRGQLPNASKFGPVWMVHQSTIQQVLQPFKRGRKLQNMPVTRRNKP
jgi:predicted DNA-binding transcriptional regulator AlpA